MLPSGSSTPSASTTINFRGSVTRPRSLAVYASQHGLPLCHARLASGCWPSFTGQPTSDCWVPFERFQPSISCGFLLSQASPGARMTFPGSTTSSMPERCHQPIDPTDRPARFRSRGRRSCPRIWCPACNVTCLRPPRACEPEPRSAGESLRTCSATHKPKGEYKQRNHYTMIETGIHEPGNVATDSEPAGNSVRRSVAEGRGRTNKGGSAMLPPFPQSVSGWCHPRPPIATLDRRSTSEG